MPSLVYVVANIVDVWPLSVSHLEETDKKTDGDDLVFKHIHYLNFNFLHSCSHCLVFFQKKGIDGYFYVDQMARTEFCLFHMILEVCKYGFQNAPFGSGWYV